LKNEIKTSDETVSDTESEKSSEEYFEVEKIIGHKPADEGYDGWKDGKIAEYHIKWISQYSNIEETWELALETEEQEDYYELN